MPIERKSISKNSLVETRSLVKRENSDIEKSDSFRCDIGLISLAGKNAEEIGSMRALSRGEMIRTARWQVIEARIRRLGAACDTLFLPKVGYLVF